MGDSLGWKSVIYPLFFPIDWNRLSKLQVPGLSGTKVRVRILESLAAFPSLKILDIRDNKLEGSFTTKG